MRIDPDTSDGGEPQGTVSRSHERVGKNPSIYPYL